MLSPLVACVIVKLYTILVLNSEGVMVSGRIAIGVIGASAHYGWAKRAHMPALAALPEYELMAVCTANAESAQESKELYGAQKAYSDYKEIIADPNIDVIDVCVRAPSHYLIALEALRSGKHVLCEWPLGASSAQAVELANSASQQNSQTGVILQSRYAPGFMYVRELLGEGYVGDILSVNMTMFLPGQMRSRTESSAWSADKSNGAHVLNIHTGHALDVFLWCIDSEFSSIQSLVGAQIPTATLTDTQRVIDVTSPDNVLIQGRLQNNALASVHIASIPAHGSAFRMEIYGTEGTLVAQSSQMVEMVDPIITGARADGGKLEVMPPPEHLRLAPASTPPGVAVNVAQMFRKFSECLRTGQPFAPSFEEAANRQSLLARIDNDAPA